MAEIVVKQKIGPQMSYHLYRRFELEKEGATSRAKTSNQRTQPMLKITSRRRGLFSLKGRVVPSRGVKRLCLENGLRWLLYQQETGLFPDKSQESCKRGASIYLGQRKGAKLMLYKDHTTVSGLSYEGRCTRVEE